MVYYQIIIVFMITLLSNHAPDLCHLYMTTGLMRHSQLKNEGTTEAVAVIFF